MNFWTFLLALAGVCCYVYVGAFWFAELERTPPNLTGVGSKIPPATAAIALTSIILFWPIYIIAAAIQWPHVVGEILDYYMRVRLVRWLAIVATLVFLGFCGPRLKARFFANLPPASAPPSAQLEYTPAVQAAQADTAGTSTVY